MESYFLTFAKLAPVMTEEYSLVSAVQSQQGTMLQALEGTTQQLQHLELSIREEPWSSGQRRIPRISRAEINQSFVTNVNKKGIMPGALLTVEHRQETT